MSKVLKPIIIESEDKQFDYAYFDITLIVNDENEIEVIDNSQVNWRDFVDCSTIAVHSLKIEIE